MTNVVDLGDYRRKFANRNHRKVIIPEGLSRVLALRLNPIKFGSILIATSVGVYEWDIMNEELEKVSNYIGDDI